MTDEQYAKLRSLICRRAEALYIDGSAPSTMLNYKFDIELLPGAYPVKQRMPKYSLAQAEKEKHHLQKHEHLKQLRTPTDAQRSSWITKAHSVHKYDDPNGRWIMDFRPLNASTKPMPIIIDDCGHVVRELAGKAWKSVFDAFAGFNQMEATERARQSLTIATSKGLRQWLVCPFGVRNGPAYYQNAMQGSFKNCEDDMPADAEALLKFFMDDGSLGSGNFSSSLDSQFDLHLTCLEKVFERAISCLSLIHI